MMYLFLVVVDFCFHFKMKTKAFLLYACSGYIYGLLLVDVCQSFPASNFKMNTQHPHKNAASATNFHFEAPTAQTLLSSMDITSFIDQYSSLSADRYSGHKDQVKRFRRSSSKSSSGQHTMDENMMNHEAIQHNVLMASNQNQDRNILANFDDELDGANQPKPRLSSLQSSTSSKFSHDGSPQNGDQYPTNLSSPGHGTPQYMLDLFARFQNDPFSQPASNIVRSFFNEATSANQLSYDMAYSVCLEERGFHRCPRVHHLKFNVASVPEHEHVTMAELRLFKIVERDRRRYVGVNRKVEVVELIRASAPEFDGNRTHHEISQRIVLDSRRIIGRASGWETFFITQAIRRWVKSGTSLLHELEVYIENLSEEGETNFVDFEQNSMTTNEPLLIVFSDDASNHHKLEHKEELQELLSHGRTETDLESPVKDFATQGDFFQRHAATHKIVKEEQELNRRKRSAYRQCHLERMYVNFEEIGYDTWIINPKGYPAGHCVGSCDFPFHRLTVSPHGVIQSQMYSRHSNRYQKPCCVPTKLGPISLLYIEKNSLTYKYNYEGMQVLECGCR